jgi:hypothetical protein
VIVTLTPGPCRAVFSKLDGLTRSWGRCYGHSLNDHTGKPPGSSHYRHPSNGAAPDLILSGSQIKRSDSVA